MTEANRDGRLDSSLAQALPELSRSRIKTLIQDGSVTLTGPDGGATIADPAYRVKPGQTFAIIIPEVASAAPEGQRIALDVFFEDASLIVVNKPPGMVVHPAPGSPDLTLVNALIAHCGESLSGIGGVARPGIVHRLDKGTSGLLVAAKTDRAHRALSAQFAEHAIERAYKALVWGVPRRRTGRIEAPIGRSPRNRKKMAVVTRGGKPAVTRYTVEETFGEAASLLDCRLETGRTHQIRVHLAHMGHPLIGDPLYGRGRGKGKLPEPVRAAVTALGRQALHAYRLGFAHPETGEFLCFEAKPPADIQHLINELETI